MLADIIVGKAKGHSVKGKFQSSYVRLATQNRTWLVEGDVNARFDAINWSINELVDVDPDTIQSLSLKIAGAQTILLSRTEAGDSTLELRSEVPAGRKIHQYQIDYLASLFQQLDFVDAEVIVESDSREHGGIVATAETTDQFRVTLSVNAFEPDGLVWTEIDVMHPADVAQSRSGDPDRSRNPQRFHGWRFLLPRKAGDRLKLRLTDLLVEN